MAVFNFARNRASPKSRNKTYRRPAQVAAKKYEERKVEHPFLHSADPRNAKFAGQPPIAGRLDFFTIQKNERGATVFGFYSMPLVRRVIQKKVIHIFIERGDGGFSRLKLVELFAL